MHVWRTITTRALHSAVCCTTCLTMHGGGMQNAIVIVFPPGVAATFRLETRETIHPNRPFTARPRTNIKNGSSCCSPVPIARLFFGNRGRCKKVNGEFPQERPRPLERGCFLRRMISIRAGLMISSTDWLSAAGTHRRESQKPWSRSPGPLVARLPRPATRGWL